MAVGSIGLEERAKVELVDHIEHEPGQVVGRQPVAHIGWEQKGLVAVTGKEVVGHGRSYAIGLPCYPHHRPSQQPFPQQARTRQSMERPERSIGGRSHKDTILGSTVRSATASSSAVRVLRSICWCSRLLNCSMVLAAS
jgi:hypothetical protein